MSEIKKFIEKHDLSNEVETALVQQKYKKLKHILEMSAKDLENLNLTGGDLACLKDAIAEENHSNQSSSAPNINTFQTITNKTPPQGVEKPCKFGDKCKIQGCLFKHDFAANVAKKCRYDERCTNMACTYEHTKKGEKIILFDTNILMNYSHCLKHIAKNAKAPLMIPLVVFNELDHLNKNNNFTARTAQKAVNECASFQVEKIPNERAVLSGNDNQILLSLTSISKFYTTVFFLTADINFSARTRSIANVKLLNDIFAKGCTSCFDSHVLLAVNTEMKETANKSIVITPMPKDQAQVMAALKRKVKGNSNTVPKPKYTATKKNFIVKFEAFSHARKAQGKLTVGKTVFSVVRAPHVNHTATFYFDCNSNEEYKNKCEKLGKVGEVIQFKYLKNLNLGMVLFANKDANKLQQLSETLKLSNYETRKVYFKVPSMKLNDAIEAVNKCCKTISKYEKVFVTSVNNCYFCFERELAFVDKFVEKFVNNKNLAETFGLSMYGPAHEYSVYSFDKNMKMECISTQSALQAARAATSNKVNFVASELKEEFKQHLILGDKYEKVNTVIYNELTGQFCYIYNGNRRVHFLDVSEFKRNDLMLNYLKEELKHIVSNIKFQECLAVLTMKNVKAFNSVAQLQFLKVGDFDISVLSSLNQGNVAVAQMKNNGSDSEDDEASGGGDDDELNSIVSFSSHLSQQDDLDLLAAFNDMADEEEEVVGSLDE